jgi:dTMP kinase
MTLFIVVEGIDGTGKTTLSHALSHVLDAWDTREPFCGSIRDEISCTADQTDKLILFCKDRLDHNSLIRTELETRDVVCDRYWPSTIAYQGKTLGYQYVLDLQPSNNIKPDLLIYLTASLDTIWSRLSERGEDRMDRRRYDELMFGYEIAMRHLDMKFRGQPVRHEAHKCRVVRLNGRDDLEKNLEQIGMIVQEIRKRVEGNI